MSCCNCQSGNPVVESKADLPDTTTSGLCTGAIRTISETGEVWILVHNEDIDPLIDPLQREWVKLFPADSIEGFKWAGTYFPDGVGPITAYLADDSDSVVTGLNPGYPLVPSGSAADIVRFSINVRTNTLSDPYTVTVFYGGVATAATITVLAGATGIFNATGMPVSLAAGDQDIDIVIVGTGEVEASSFLSAVVELRIPRL